MSSCEKCWNDGGGDFVKYLDLVENRIPCTPEEQAGGTDANWCAGCNRATRHRYTGVCMNPWCRASPSMAGHDQRNISGG